MNKWKDKNLNDETIIQERYDLVYRLYFESFWTMQEIGKKMGYTRAHIRNILGRGNLKDKQIKLKRQCLVEAARSNENLTYEQAAKLVRVSVATVKKLLALDGLKLLHDNEWTGSEEVKRHPVYDNYGATESGKIISFARGRIKLLRESGKPTAPNGYQHFHCKQAGTTLYVHRFIWECFNGLIPDDGHYHIHHRNGQKADNRLSNLELLTASDHMAQTMTETLANGNGRGKLTAEDAEEIRRLNSVGKLSTIQIAERFDISATMVYRIINGDAWK